MKRMRFSFVGQMLDLLLLEIIPVVLIPHISNTFGVAVTSVKLKNDLNPFQIRIYLFLVNTFSASRTFFRRLNPEKKFGQAGLAEFFLAAAASRKFFSAMAAMAAA